MKHHSIIILLSLFLLLACKKDKQEVPVIYYQPTDLLLEFESLGEESEDSITKVNDFHIDLNGDSIADVKLIAEHSKMTEYQGPKWMYTQTDSILAVESFSNDYQILGGLDSFPTCLAAPYYSVVCYGDTNGTYSEFTRFTGAKLVADTDSVTLTAFYTQQASLILFHSDDHSAAGGWNDWEYGDWVRFPTGFVIVKSIVDNKLYALEVEKVALPNNTYEFYLRQVVEI